MRAMQLHPRKSGVRHNPRRINKTPRHPLDIRARHLPRRREHQSTHSPFQIAVSQSQRNRAWGYRRTKDSPSSGRSEGLAAGMAELYDSRRAVRLTGFGVSSPFGEDSRVGGFVCIAVVDSCIERAAEVIYIDLDVACPVSRPHTV